MKIVYNSIIPFKGYKAINLFGILFVRKESKNNIDNITINHEKIHTKQMKELLYVFFYLIYFGNWFINLFKYKFDSHTAYRNIMFEKEAYDNEEYLDYLYIRKSYQYLR